MLKKDLEARVKVLEAEKKATQKLVKKITEKAIDNCCDEALPYASELNDVMDLKITTDSYININVELPLKVRQLYADCELNNSDFKLTIKGIEVNVTSIEDIDEN